MGLGSALQRVNESRSGEMGLRVEGGGLILDIQSLSLVHVYVIRAGGDGIETQVGTYRIFRKKRTSETTLAGVGTWES